MKALRLSKKHADMKTMTSHDGTRTSAMANLHITDSFVEVSNGHILFRLPIASEDIDIPDGIEDKGELPNADGILLDPTVLEKALKHTNPKFPSTEAVYVSHVDGQPLLQATDLDTSVSMKAKRDDSSFPDTSKIIPAQRHHVVTLNARELKPLIDWACQHASKGDVALRFSVDSPFAPTVIEVIDEALPEKPLALLMPLRDEEMQKKQDKAA